MQGNGVRIAAGADARVTRIGAGVDEQPVARVVAMAVRALTAADAAVGVVLGHAVGAAGRVGRAVPFSASARRLRPRLTTEWIVALLATALSIGFYAYYASRGLTLAYGDAINHMLIARRVIASRTPGLAQLGTTWLPFNHALMLPLIWNDFLFRSGFAGAFPSMCAYVAGTVYTYRLGQLAFSSAGAGLVAAAIFAFNPNTLYMQSTAMSELDLMCLAVVAVYYTLRWTSAFHPADLVKAAAAGASGTLVRYDGWALAAGLALVVCIAALRKGRAFAEASTILFGTLAFVGCAGWLVYNQVIFGNALEFFNGASSSQVQQTAFARQKGLPTLHNVLLSLHVYVQAIVDTVWLPVGVCALLGFVVWVIRARFATRTLPLYVLLMPLAFNWLSLVTGNSTIETPEIPFSGISTYYNERYGMMMIPAVALFLGFLTYRLFLLRTAAVATVIAFAVAGTFLAPPYVLADPLVGVVRSPDTVQAGDWLRSHYHGGAILAGYSAFGPAMFYSALPDTDFITDSNGAQFTKALADPARTVTWIAMDQEYTMDPVWRTLSKYPEWRQGFVLAATFGPIQIYERGDAQPGASISKPTTTSSNSIPTPVTPPSPTISLASSPTAVPATMLPAATATPEQQPALTATPTAAPTALATATPTPIPSATPTATPMPSPAPTPTATP